MVDVLVWYRDDETDVHADGLAGKLVVLCRGPKSGE